MAPLADLLQEAGHHTVIITLPGHGTTADDLIGATWQQWLDAVIDATPDRAVIVGQSMGGTLAIAAASSGVPVNGIVAINAPAPDPDALDGLEWRQSRGHDWIDGPELAQGEIGYTRFPVGALVEMAAGAMSIDASNVRCSVALLNGALDEVVDPFSAHVWRAVLTSADISIQSLPNTGHVATFGPDIDIIAGAVLAMA